MDKGWIKLHRSIMDNDFYMTKPFSKGQAWIDLLLLAEHKSHKKMWRGSMVEFRRGDVNLSITKLADRWGWSRKKTAHYLAQLEGAEMIHLNAHRNRTTITIIKWASYQGKGTTDGTSDGTSKDTTEGTSKGTSKGTYLKNVKNDKEEKKKDPPSAVPDPVPDCDGHEPWLADWVVPDDFFDDVEAEEG